MALSVLPGLVKQSRPPLEIAPGLGPSPTRTERLLQGDRRPMLSVAWQSPTIHLQTMTFRPLRPGVVAPPCKKLLSRFDFPVIPKI